MNRKVNFMRKNHVYGTMLLGVVIASFLFGCGKKVTQQEGGPVSIRVAYWGDIEEKRIITETVSTWEAQNPDTKVVLEHIPPNSYADKILTEIAGGDAPDIIFSDVDIFVTFFFKNALLELTPFLEKDKEFSLQDYFPELVARFTRNGKVFCIPRDTAPFGCVFFNKKAFDDLHLAYPKDNWNMEDFLAIAKKLTVDAKGLTPNDNGFDPKHIKRYGFWGWSIHNFIYSYGGNFVDSIDNPTKCLMNEQPVVDAMQFYLDLSYKYYVSPMPSDLSNMGLGIPQLFSMERLAMFQSGIWESPSLKKTVGNRFDWDVVMAPSGPGGKRGFGTGGSGYAILKNTKHPEKAWEVLKCLAGDNGQEMLAAAGIAQPASKKIADGPAWAGVSETPLNRKTLNNAVRYIVYNPFHPKWREAWERFVLPQLDLILNRRVTVKEGLDKMTKEVNALLSAHE